MQGDAFAALLQPIRLKWANLLVLAIVLASSAVPAHSQTSAGDPLQGTNSPFAERYTEIVRSGEALAKAHNYVGALQEYDKALALGPPTPLAHSTLLTYRADALWHLGRSAEALTDQNRAVEIDPNAFALWARGETLRKRKRYADALRDYDAVLKLAPNDSATHAARGIVLWHLGKTEKANEEFDRAVTLRADKYNLMQRAYFLASQKRFTDAIADYSKVLETDTSHLPARLNRANARAQAKEYNRALADYEAALRTHKDDPRIYRGRGWVFERQGRHDLARADYLRALALAPNDEWLKKALKALPKH